MNVEVSPASVAGTLADGGNRIARVGVVGAGQMGNGIAHVCALAELPVTLLDVNPDGGQGAGDHRPATWNGRSTAS